ncbi:MAG: hypothetical protein IJW21_03520 [Clostridia bacterium]|nr:hypothetical protein [Clostridia bacterium]
MYSRNYGRGDISAKITPPPAYSGSAIQGKDTGGSGEREAPKPAENSFAPFSQSIPFPKSAGGEQKPAPPCEEEEHCEKEQREEEHMHEHMHGHTPPCESGKKEKSSFLSSFLPDLSTEDLILIGIIIALAFDLADRDILLVALVVAVVIM